MIAKNAELEKQVTPTRKVKLFKTDLLQLTADELNYTLCLFVKEVRKPNGAEYAPDTIYYLCLGKLLEDSTIFWIYLFFPQNIVVFKQEIFFIFS